MSRYATDADLTARIPETSTVDSALRGYALEDAATMLDDGAYGEKLLRAHVLLAAHYLAKSGALSSGSGGGGGAGPISSWSVGETSVTYAVAAAAVDPTLGSTKYGQLFIELVNSVPHEPQIL